MNPQFALCQGKGDVPSTTDILKKLLFGSKDGVVSLILYFLLKSDHFLIIDSRTKKVVAPHEPERLTSSERSQICRKAIYADPLLHQALKDAEALRKRLKSN